MTIHNVFICVNTFPKNFFWLKKKCNQHITGGQRWRNFCIFDGLSSSVRHFFMWSTIKMKRHFFRSNTFTLSLYKIIMNTNKKLEEKTKKSNGGKNFEKMTIISEFLVKWGKMCIIHVVSRFSFSFFSINSCITMIIMLWNDGKRFFLWER